MPDVVTVKIEGLAELESNLLRLSDDLNKRAIITAARAGANVLRKAIEDREHSIFKSRTGHMAKNLRVTYRIQGRGLSGAAVWYHVGYGNDEFYAYFQEHGYHAIGRGKGRRARHRRALAAGGGLGKVYRRPFMEPGFEASWQQALDALAKSLSEYIAQQTS